MSSPLSSVVLATRTRPISGRTARAFVALCTIQGLYSLLTGVWPLADIASFQAVTGVKTDHLVTGRQSDHWLVNTVAVLLTANALVFLFAAWRGRPSPEVMLLAVASAIGLAAIDLIYVSRGVLAPIYLADAAIEFVFLGGWVWVATHLPADRTRRLAYE
jgi:hypothetical protein